MRSTRASSSWASAPRCEPVASLGAGCGGALSLRPRPATGCTAPIFVTMTTTSFFSIRLTRETVLEGRRHPAGRVLELEATDAAGLVRSGRARLVDLADLGPLLDALDARHGPAA